MKKIKVEGGVLYHGNCLQVMDNLGDNSVDLVIGSPPYTDSRSYLEEGKDLKISMDLGQWLDFMCAVFYQSIRVSKGLAAFVVGHGKGARKWDGGPAKLECLLLDYRINLRSTCYYKRNGIMGSGGNDWFRADVERIICAFGGTGELPWHDNTACGSPPKFKPGGRPSNRTQKGTRVKGKTYKPPKLVNPGNFIEGGSSVIDCGAVGGGHMGSNIAHEGEAPFPEEVPERFIRSFCPPGGVVLDPFIGTGTTAAVAIKTGRRFIGIDIRKSQVELAKRRITQAHIVKGFVI